MAKPSVLICAPGFDSAQSTASVDMLSKVDLGDSAKFVVTTGKFDTAGVAKAFNVEADYPAQSAVLATLRSWAALQDADDARLRDGFDLFSLRRLLDRHTGYKSAVLLRDLSDFGAEWAKLQADDRCVVVFGGEISPPTSLYLDLTDDRTRPVLDAAWQLYISGAVYGMEPYSFKHVFAVAGEAVATEAAIKSSIEVPSDEPQAGVEQVEDEDDDAAAESEAE